MLTHDPKPYFDPRTGEEITAAEWVARYTVNAFVFVERPREPLDAPNTSLPGLTNYGSRCRYCSTSIPDGQDVCILCAEKHGVNQAPPTSWAIGAGTPKE